MTAPRLVFVTGKGGSGKTTVAAAIALGLAASGRRVLLAEGPADRGLARLFGRRSVPAQPTAVLPGLSVVRLDPDRLLRDYFHRTLRVSFVAERLLASATFRALAEAAPGVREFLFLDRLVEWTATGTLRRRRSFDHVVVDAPATGHALQMLRTPRNLAGMVAAGPIGTAARRLLRFFGSPDTAAVVLVTLPEEMSVSEAIEAHCALRDDLVVPVLRPVLNRVQPKRFTAAEAARILELAERRPADPLVHAARLHVGVRREAERHLGRLRRAFGRTPACFPAASFEAADRNFLQRAGKRLARALLTGGVPE